MLKEFHEIGKEAFHSGVQLGTDYFEDTFKVKGITPRQQSLVANKYLRVFDERAEALYKDDAIAEMRENPTRNPLEVLSSFDRYLLMYANVAASAAYSVFVRSVGLLNTWMSRAYSLAGVADPPGPVMVQWILEPDAKHSEDCWKLAQGRDGDGVWDAKELAAMDIFPKSSLLDCGGNCRCSVRPVAGLEPGAASWLNNLLELPNVKGVLNVTPNMNTDDFLGMLASKKFTIPTEIRQWMSETGYLRRKEFWDKLPDEPGSFFTIVKTGPKFRVEGATYSLKKTGQPGRIVLQLTLPEGVTFKDLTFAQRQDILRTISHELGHTIMNVSTGELKGLYGTEIAEAILDQVSKSRAMALAQVESNFEKIVASLSGKTLTPQVLNDVKLMRVFLQDSDQFMTQLFKAVENSQKFGGIDARDAWMMFERVLQQYSTGTMLTRGYQLWNLDEYFAEWFSLLLTDPRKAALFNPALNRTMGKMLPGIFKPAGSIGKVLLPEAVSIWNRIDVPRPTTYKPISPSWTSYKKNFAGIRSITEKVGDRTVLRQVQEVVREYPAFMRDEFFDGLKIQFVDRIQMGRRAGTRTFIGYHDKKSGIFFINWDRWRQMDVDQRAFMLADTVSKNFLEDGSNAVRRQIQQRYNAYLQASLSWIDRKATIQNLGTRDLRDVIQIVFGSKELDLKPNITFWTRNFDAHFKSAISNITDLPVLNVESLASPEAFFREWMRMFFTKPSGAAAYPGFRDLVDEFLRVR